MALTESSEATAVGAAAKEDCSKELSREAALMASAEVVHSAYVPFKLHRQLEFMEFNKGKEETRAKKLLMEFFR